MQVIGAVSGEGCRLVRWVDIVMHSRNDYEISCHFSQYLMITMVIDFNAVPGEDWTQMIGSWHIVYIPCITGSVYYMPGIFKWLWMI